MSTVRIAGYTPEYKADWNRFVETSKNGTFLLNRDYMDYHADRFTDASLVVFDDGNPVALLPAHRSGSELSSHNGLTYGGFIVDQTMLATSMLTVFDATLDWLRARSFTKLLYKTIPTIYHQLPAEEDRYALFRHQARLTRRDVLTVISPLDENTGYREVRRRGIKKALKSGIEVAESNDFSAYWAILESVLRERHDTKPVHSLSEIQQLAAKFPSNIRLYGAFSGPVMLAGVLVYESTRVVHAQYIASGSEGRHRGALDLIFHTIIESARRRNLFFDFGMSTEDNGLILNEGLVGHKEGFGGRTVVHDGYELLF